MIAGFYTICVDVFRIVLLRRTIRKIGGTTLQADFYHAFMDLGSTLVAIIGIALVTIGFYYGDFVAALVLGLLLSFLSLKLVYRTALELTDIIPPEMIKNVREIVNGTEGVLNAGQILMRKSGDSIFSDITISLRGDSSFDKAHEISKMVEDNITRKIPNSKITVHFEPNWEGVPIDSKINEIASSVDGVKGVHNTSTYSSEGEFFVSIHVMVDRQMNLQEAHRISEVIERQIQNNLPETSHITVHLEPYITIPKNLKLEEKTTEKKKGRSKVAERH